MLRFTLTQCRLDSPSPDFSSFRCVRKDALYVANVVHVLGACVHVRTCLSGVTLFFLLFSLHICALNERETFHSFTVKLKFGYTVIILQ